MEGLRYHFRFFSAVVLLLSLLPGCTKVRLISGEDIIFGARSTNLPATKASYSGTTYTEGGGNYESIDWETGDELRIWCAEASEPSVHFADYIVTTLKPKTSDRYSEAALSLSTSRNSIGLRWGSGSHNFYSVYPSLVAEGVTTGMGTVSGTVGKDITGTIPALQDAAEGDITVSEGNYSAAPKFVKGQMMVGSATVDPSTGVDAGTVLIQYRPLTTAIKFTITNDTGASLPVSAVCLKSVSHPLNGGFSLEIGNLGTDGYENCSFTGTPASSNKVVAVNFPTSGDKKVTLGWGSASSAKKSLTFTVFLHPQDDLDDLTLYILEQGSVKSDGSFSSGSRYRFTELRKTDGNVVHTVTFLKHKKTYATGLFIPEGAVWHVSMDPEVIPWDNVTDGDLELDYQSSSASTFVTGWQSGSTEDLVLSK